MFEYGSFKEHGFDYKRVGVLMGGTSAERSISLKSGQAVLAALKALSIDAVGIDVGAQGMNPVEQLLQQPIDRAFVMLHGRGGEDGTMQALLEMLSIPYTGSGVLASALAMHKAKSKQLWIGAGLPTPDFVILQDTTQLEEVVTRLGLPLMVKPMQEGSSIGMTKVTTLDGLAKAYIEAKQYDDQILVEQWVHGFEYTVAVLNHQTLPIIQLKTTQDFYDFHAKYEANDTQYLLDHNLTEVQVEELNAIVLRAFDALGCRGWGRVDVMMTQEGAFKLLEVNTLPGMTDHSLVPMAAQAAGLRFEELVLAILDSSHLHSAAPTEIEPSRSER